MVVYGGGQCGNLEYERAESIEESLCVTREINARCTLLTVIVHYVNDTFVLLHVDSILMSACV